MTKTILIKNLLENNLDKLSKIKTKLAHVVDNEDAIPELPLTPETIREVCAPYNDIAFNLLKYYANINNDDFKIGKSKNVKLDFLNYIHKLSIERNASEADAFDENLNNVTNYSIKQINKLTNALMTNLSMNDGVVSNSYYLYNVKTAIIKDLTISNFKDMLDDFLYDSFLDKTLNNK